MKVRNENYTYEEVDLMAVYEKLLDIPSAERVTGWWGDLAMYELEHNVEPEKVRKRLEESLKAINMTREEFAGFRYSYRPQLIDKIRENMPQKYEAVIIFNKPMLFTNERIKKEDVPEGLYRYEIRDTDENSGEMAQIKNWVMVNHWGTVLTKEPVEPREVAGRIFTTAEGIDMDREDYNFIGDTCTVEEYLERYNEFVSEYGVPEQDDGMTMG